MINKSFYHGRQGECFQKIDKHFNEIRYEYQSQPNKTFLSKDFFYEGDSDSRLQPTKGEWKILGIGSGEREGQSFNDYPMLYSILRKFPYKTNVAFMIVGPNTKIGNHKDDEGGWRYQMCIDDGGGNQSGMYYKDIKTEKKKLHIWKTEEAFVFQPDIQPHNGYNNNPSERVTLLIDFYKESLYTKKKFDAYYQQYSDEFEGLENLINEYDKM
tara:strand:+ start:233 stop:871 length:639 start_codon:yes stop_codon:yes gene_type:complete